MSNDDYYNYMMERILNIPINLQEIQSVNTRITNVIFNNPAVAVTFGDGDKQSAVARDGDVFNPEAGIALCVMKHVYGGSSQANKILKYWMNKEAKETKKKAVLAKKEAEKKEIVERQRAKKAEKRKKFLEKKRQEEIEVHAQAILRAQELAKEKGFQL